MCQKKWQIWSEICTTNWHAELCMETSWQMYFQSEQVACCHLFKISDAHWLSHESINKRQTETISKRTKTKYELQKTINELPKTIYKLPKAFKAAERDVKLSKTISKRPKTKIKAPNHNLKSTYNECRDGWKQSWKCRKKFLIEISIV